MKTMSTCEKVSSDPSSCCTSSGAALQRTTATDRSKTGQGVLFGDSSSSGKVSSDANDNDQNHAEISEFTTTVNINMRNEQPEKRTMSVCSRNN